MIFLNLNTMGCQYHAVGSHISPKTLWLFSRIVGTFSARWRLKAPRDKLKNYQKFLCIRGCAIAVSPIGCEYVLEYLILFFVLFIFKILIFFVILIDNNNIFFYSGGTYSWKMKIVWLLLVAMILVDVSLGGKGGGKGGGKCKGGKKGNPFRF